MTPNFDALRLACRTIENHLMPALGRGWTVSLECKTDQADGLTVLAIHATLTHYRPHQVLRVGPFPTLAEAVERARRMTL